MVLKVSLELLVFKPIEFIKKLNSLENLTVVTSPLVDGITLSRITGIEPSPKLGMLKGWLYRIQVEQNISNQRKVLESLNYIDWENDNYQSWPTPSWP